MSARDAPMQWAAYLTVEQLQRRRGWSWQSARQRLHWLQPLVSMLAWPEACVADLASASRSSSQAPTELASAAATRTTTAMFRKVPGPAPRSRLQADERADTAGCETVIPGDYSGCS